MSGYCICLSRHLHLRALLPEGTEPLFGPCTHVAWTGVRPRRGTLLLLSPSRLVLPPEAPVAIRSLPFSPQTPTMVKDVHDQAAAEVVELDSLPNGVEGTALDPVAMIGHKPTVPRTLDRLIGLIGVNSSVVCPWPNFYFVAALNLGNGGTLGLLIGTIAATAGMAPVYLSLAEKMRKYPTAGGTSNAHELRTSARSECSVSSHMTRGLRTPIADNPSSV